MKCPTCGVPMPIGAPHGGGIGQYECRRCNVYVPIPDRR
jgi:hypothetical protein